MKTLISILLFCLFISNTFCQKATEGPVFFDMGPVFDVNNADFIPEKGDVLKAIFDIDRKVNDHSKPNPLITSLHRFYNMHVRHGVDENDIHLAFVVHGSSTGHVLNNAAYLERYGHNNPNTEYIKALSEKGVKMYVCGQSASYNGLKKEDLNPEVEMALSAMTVLTMYQMDGYGMIRF